ncbi:hypothetical protein ACLMJK_005740 [Lecanora helva]
MLPLSTLPLTLLTLLPTLTTSIIITQTSTATLTAAASSLTPTTTILTTPSSTPPSAQYTSDTAFRAAVLNSTNTYRTQHNATALTWNASLATYALTWATHCNWAHSHGPNGENLAENYPNVTTAIDGWGDERAHYNFNNDGNGFSEGTGHFSQLVWKATTSVGCARVDCEGNNVGGDARGWFLVCEYWPAGNVLGMFREEVQREVQEAKDGVAGYVKYIHGKMTGGAQRVQGISWKGLVGVGVVVVLGLW